jgi:cytochrome P450
MSPTPQSSRPEADLLSPEVVADPYPYFARLRAEDPVHWDERSRAWVVTRYNDVVAAHHDERLSAERAATYISPDSSNAWGPQADPAFGVLASWMVFKDPPDHTRLRGLVRQGFTARALERLRPRIQIIVNQLLDGVKNAGRADLITDFAFPLPAIVIAELLGVPVADRDRFKIWSDQLSRLLFGAAEPDRYGHGRQGLLELTRYFERLIDRYRTEPGDTLIHALIRAEEEREGEALSREEVLATCILLLFAGHETTTHLIGNGILALLQHPDQRQVLEDDPSAVAPAVEEFLRYDGPAKLAPRSVKSGFELAGKRLERGQRVLLALASANRDPERFADPDRLDLKREENPHVGFGVGIHYCLGATLARLETRIAVVSVLERLPRMRLVTDHLEWHPTLLSRGLRALPVAVD